MLARFALALLCAFAVLAQGVRASDSADALLASAPGPQKAFATLIVDGVDFDSAIVLVDRSDVWLAAADATRAHVPVDGAKTRTIGNVAYVSLASLAPGTTFRFDETTFTLSIFVRPAALGTKIYGTSAAADSGGAAARRASAFLNYDLSAQTGGGASGFFESALSSHDSLLYSSEAVQTGSGAQRGQTYFAHDDVKHLRREIVGDVAGSSGDALLGEIDVLGVGVQRQFAIDPYLYRFSQPSISGLLSEPGTAQVYVNGLLARSIPLSPGGFDLTSIPVSTGNSDIAVVIRDADGNVRTYRQSFFGSEALLRKGLTDYSYGAGLLRTSSGGGYDNLAIAASYRVGASDGLTLGGQVAATAHRSEIEGSFDVKVGRAVVHGAEAVSNAYAVAGSATNIAFAYVGANNGISLASTLRGQTFSIFDANALPIESAHFEINATASQRLSRSATLSASYFRQTFPTLAAETTLLATVTQALLGGQLSASFARSRSGSAAQTSALGLSLTTQVGRRGSLTVGQSIGNDAQDTVDYTFAPPSNDVGFGYSLHHASGTTATNLAMLQDHTAIGDVALYAGAGSHGAFDGTISVSGAAVAIDGHLLPARPVTGAFALVESGDVGHVPVTVDGRTVGSTNGHGLLVVASIGAYADNRIQLDDTATPLGVEVSRETQFVSPGNRGGSVASFAVRRITYFAGTIALEPGHAIPADAPFELVRGETRVRTVLDDSGAYYFENLAPGRYHATVQFGAKPCVFDFDVPTATGVANDLGKRTCVR